MDDAMEMQSIAFDLAAVLGVVAVILGWSKWKSVTRVKPPKSGGFINDEGKWEGWVD